MAEEIDFSNRKSFPGTHGNRFDVVLRVLDTISAIPGPVFAILLLVIALLATLTNVPASLGLYAFFLVDWILLSLLPRLNISFGPAQPTALMLGGMRAVAALISILASLPLPIAIGIQVLGTVCLIYGFFIGPRQIRVTYQKLTSPKLAGQKPFRLLHLGDLHIERITTRERQLNALVRELKPDIILFSGDILNLSYLKDPTAQQHARQIMQEWQAPAGVYLVSGSPAVDLDEIMPELVRDLPLHWLQDRSVTLQIGENKIKIIGLSCTHKPFIDGPALESLVHNPDHLFSVLLYHSPDLAPAAARLGIDLQLSGHTHGGQVRLPFYGAITTASLYGKRYESGRREVDHLTLYVTRGIGLEGAGAPRVRFLCPPEIILWEISGT